MGGLRMTTAVAALVGVGAFGALALRAQDDGSALSEAISAQQQEVSGDAGVAEAEPDLEGTLSEEELDGLVAPVALYPDALLAQVLVAAAFPLQVAKADQLIAASSDMTEEELSDALAQQQFDPSVLVLMSGFPTVISRMADDLDWTDRLGQAMIAQDDDVLASVQRMRAEADAAGTLTSNEAQVVEKDDGQIYINPADPDVIYVPTYDPEVVYSSRSFDPEALSYPVPRPRPYSMSSQSYTPPQTYSEPQTYVAPETYTAAPTYVAPQASSNPLANPLTAGALAFGGALLVSELFGDDDGGGNNNDNRWDDYWQSGRPIDWRDRQVYARPGNYYGPDRTSWSRERDRYWDRSARDWRRDDAAAISAYQAGREDALKALQRNQKTHAERMREAARQDRLREEARRERAADDRRWALEQREKAEKAAERQREREQEARREARREDAAAEARAEERAKKERQDRAAARKEQQAEEAKAAAAKARRQEAAKEAKAEAAATQQRQEARAKRQAEEERQAKAAQRQKAQEEKAAERRKAARQAARKCRKNPDANDCTDD